MVFSSVASLACFCYALPFLVGATVSHFEPSEGFCDDGTSSCSISLPRELSAPAGASLIQVKKEALNARSSAGTESAAKTVHRRSTSQVRTLHRRSAGAPCSCEANSPQWVPQAPRPAKCIFIDLGAADGNTFRQFINNGYGPVKNCPNGGSYEAILVEANPFFNLALQQVESNYPRTVRSIPSSAAYMCQGHTSFFLDTVDTAQNYWGSSMSPNARDVIRSGQKETTVPLVNVARLIYESVLPEDWVMVKMDIEGSEHDILPCLANSPSAKLVDALYVENHPVEWSMSGADPGALQRSLLSLQQQGVQVPKYDSPS